MARIEAFRGLRYDLGQVGTLSDVVAPPYDVIDSALQQQLYEKHPQNVIRVELTRAESGDDALTRYARARRTWLDWQIEGVIRADNHPSLYVLHQEYEVEGRRYLRKGVFARVRLERFGEGAIYPHEQTLSGPKEDRFALMQATHTNLSPVFGLYSDEKLELQTLLDNAVERTLPIEAADHLGVTSRMWPVQAPALLRRAVELFHDKPIFIADGHHRYETALRYRDALEQKHEKLPEDHPAQSVLMALVGMSDPGLVILPTHRLITGLGRMTAEQLVERLAGHFEIEAIGQGLEAARETWERIEMEGTQDLLGFGTVVDGKWLLARFGADELMQKLASEHSEAWRGLAVSRLHVLVLNQLLSGLGAMACRYLHLLEEVTAYVEQQGCDLACLVPQVTMGQVTEIAGTLEKMPPKSTYFYPKILTGLVFHSLK